MRLIAGKPLQKPTVRRMNIGEISWLAGLFEGEGSVLVPSPERQFSPRMTIAMNDEDIIQRVKDITGVGSIVRDGNLYRWQSSRTNDVLHILCSIIPLLGERRRSQIIKVLDHMEQRKNGR